LLNLDEQGIVRVGAEVEAAIYWSAK